MNLFPVRKSDKFGFIDGFGYLVIDYQFDWASIFSEKLARVKLGSKWGYIGENGKIKIAPDFDSCLEFSENLAAVRQNGKWGFIKSNGEIVIDYQYHSCRSFHNGLARVQPTQLLQEVFINQNGSIILSERNFLLSKFCEGLINCPSQGLWGYLTPDNNFHIAPQYLSAYPFFEGLAAVAKYSEEHYQFIDKQNNVCIEKEYKGADIRFSENLCRVWDNEFGFIDRNGHQVIPYDFQYAGHFSEGRAVIKLDNKSKYGFIDTAGQIIIKPQFTHAKPYQNGLSAVIVGEEYDQFQYGYVNKFGEYVWLPSR